MKRIFVFILVLFVCGMVQAEPGARIGAGVHYWTAIDDIEVDDVDEDGLAYMLSWQYDTGALLMWELDLEVFPDDLTGADETLYAPQAFLLLGGGIYGGIGAGWFYYDGEFADDPFYILRAGLNMNILPRIYLDLNANYHFSDLGDLDDVDDDIDSDTLTVGAMVRLQL